MGETVSGYSVRVRLTRVEKRDAGEARWLAGCGVVRGRGRPEVGSETREGAERKLMGWWLRKVPWPGIGGGGGVGPM
jgi:hypothetical protein